MMKRTVPRLLICGLLVTALLAFIWGNSLLPGEDSGELSGFVGTLLQTLLPFLKLDTQQGMHLLRKAAHFSEFAALGVSLAWLFGMLMKKPLPAAVFPTLCGVIAAAADETIQLFSPDRGPSIKDVGIDSCGVLTGVILLIGLHHLVRRIKHIKKR